MANGTRVTAVSLIALVMVLAQWIVPLLWDRTPGVPSIVLGIPAQLGIFVGYGAVSMLALWVTFRLVWPSTDE